ncbi:MAG: hypothetical protein WCD16_05195 [Paracoccaceae bacterium]
MTGKKSARRTVPQGEGKPQAREQGKPLPSHREERFVQAYAVSFDGAAAAEAAGYGDEAKRIWSHLLESPDIRARLREIRLGPHVPPPQPDALASKMLEWAFTDFSSLLVRDPVTGTFKLDPDLATPGQINALDIRTVEKSTAKGVEITTTIATPDKRQLLRLVNDMLGLDEAEKRKMPTDMLMETIADINRKGSRFPLATRGETWDSLGE